MLGNKIIIVDDHPLFRGALRQALESAFQDFEVTEAGSLNVLLDVFKTRNDIDLVLLDLTMPGVQGLSGLLLLRAQYPEVPVVVVSASEDAATIRRAIEFGALGFIPKSQTVENIREAVRSVMNGNVWVPEEIDISEGADAESADLASRLATLTPQQVRVLMMLGEGLLNKQIAYKLTVSEATVKAHVSAILQKLNVDSRTQAVIAVNKIDREWRIPNA